MERIISPEERIRRAEEIYSRRKMQSGVRVASSTVNSGTKSSLKTETIIAKKMIIQILICIVIYFIFYLIQNTNYIFSEDVISKTKELLSHDINFYSIYSQASEYISDFLNNEEEKNKDVTDDQSTQETIDGQNEVIDEEGLNSEAIENTGGLDVDEATLGVSDPPIALSQMEIDANDIKSINVFIKPLEGTITSRFGNRNPTTATVPKYHTGIDIAANTGTTFIAAIGGTVELVSSQGDYGNHIKIVNGDVTTLYAHCNKVYVKQGDVIKQGDTLGEVGSTGNTTGPHLHFEIRKSDRYVNPDLILQF